MALIISFIIRSAKHGSEVVTVYIYNILVVHVGYLRLTTLGSWTHTHVVFVTFRTRVITTVPMKMLPLSSWFRSSPSTGTRTCV
jgi:hypothetical protein